MAGAGDLKGTGEGDEGKAIRSADINTTRGEPEKKRMQREPAASSEVAEEVAACTREPAASTEEEEELQRKLTEERVAEQYTVPVEVFAAGCSSGWALVGSIKGFQFQQVARTPRPFYVMPYLPPTDAVAIESEMKKKTRLRTLIMNPDMLASKVAAMEDINSEMRKVQPLLGQEDTSSNPNPEQKKLLFRFLDQEEEDRARAKDQHHRVASGLVGFRAQMHNRLLFAYAAKGEWDMVHKYLKQLYPELVGSDGRAHIQQIVKNLKSMYPCSEEGDIDDRSYDLMSLLSLEDWTEQLYKSRCSPASQQIHLFNKVAAEPSLIGTTDKATAVSALKKLLLDLVSCAVAKGHLADGTGSHIASRDVQELRKAGQFHINGLFTLLEKKAASFEEMVSTIDLLKQEATKVGAQGLQTICDAFLKSCKQNNDKKCKEALPKIEQEYIDICNRLERISELQDLVLLLESCPNRRNK